MRRRTATRETHLANATLARHAARIAVPRYDRRSLRPAVVHLGLGHFHRSHQAVYLDDLAQRGISMGWGIVGVGLRNRAVHAALAPQDGLYTLVQRGAERDSARVIGSIVDVRHAPDDARGVVDVLARPATRIVTITVTAAGYRAARPERGPDALGLIVAALGQRRRSGRAPFTVLSCDNMVSNGRVARDAVIGRAEQLDAGLARWIERHVAFPSSMVDRITPQTADADRRMVAARFGVADRWPVLTEPFSQWIVEDQFSDGRPPLEETGVRFVADVAPFALTKTRLLNATHCALGLLGSLAGHRHTDEAMADAVFRRYTRGLMEDEIAPLLPPVPGMRQPDYSRALQARLLDPGNRDQLARLCRNSAAKVPLHILPSIAAARAAGADHPLLTLAVAGWLRFDGGPREPRALRGAVGSLARDDGFVAELTDALRGIERDGVRAALAAALDAPARLAA